MDLRQEELRGRRLAHYMWGELEKIALAQGGPGAAGATQPQSGELEGGIQREVEGEEEASPAHGVVAARVEQVGDKKARGIPVIQPPPGFVFNPELSAFVPDEQNPGWMQAEEAAEAAKAQSFYQQGQQDLVQQQAQQNVDQQVSQQAEQSVMQDQMAQQQMMAQQQADQVAPQMQAQERAKAMAKAEAAAATPGLQSPERVVGERGTGVSTAEKKPTKKKTSPKKSDDKSVTISFGK